VADQPIEQHSTKRTIITDARGNKRLITGETIETVAVDPMTGGRRFVAETTVIRTECGRLITNPNESVYECTTCKRSPLAGPSVTHCERCQQIICRQCATPIEDGKWLCKVCARKAMWKKVKQWVWHLQ
jgi:hypothetical protein